MYPKSDIIALLASFFILVCLVPCQSQKIELIVSKAIPTIDLISVDNQGNIFISKKDGEILKMDKEGQVLLTYSPSKIGHVQQLDVWSPFKITAYYDSFQEMLVLNRFLSETVRYGIDDFNLGFVSNAALNFQQNLWVIDESDFSLKLIDMSIGDVLITQPFFQFLNSEDHEITFIKEYQNRLYVVDFEFGFLVFDNLGNLINSIEIKGIRSLGFEKDTFYYLNKDKLIVQEIYDSNELSIHLPRSDYKEVRKFGDYIYCSSTNQLDIYRYLSKE